MASTRSTAPGAFARTGSGLGSPSRGRLVVDEVSSFDPRGGMKDVRLLFASGQQMQGGATTDDERIRDHPSVAPPPERLRAHDGGRLLPRHIDEPVQRGL